MRADPPEEVRKRVVHTNVPDNSYPSNSIKSTSSNIFTFVPINLFNQVTTMANVYFILIAILQMIPNVSVTDGKPTILAPLSIVMLTVLFKDAYEEYYRYKKDKSENEKPVEVYEDGAFKYMTAESIKVGHIVRFRKNEIISCDAVILQSSDPEQKCYVETKGLDGETSLKVKRSFITRSVKTNSRTSVRLSKKEMTDTAKTSYTLQTGPPNRYLGEFVGSINYNGETIPLDSQNLLLKGSELKNVNEVHGVCVYTGPETKIVLNGVKFKPKRSRLMEKVDHLVIEIFIWQILIALFTALLNILLESSYSSYMPSLPNSSFWIVSMSWWLMMTSFIPISLMVTMEMVKLFQGSVLAQDQKGYSKAYDCFASANNTSVNENLGQIRYVFTDKTGTLTKNYMQFRKLYCNGKVYGEREDDDDEVLKRKMTSVENVRFRDKQFRKDIQSKSNQQFLKILALCHEIYVNEEDGKSTYNSSSPDQIALINFAKLYNKQLLGQQNKQISIAEGNSTCKIYDKLGFLPFHSDRKRMSIIIRDPDTNKIELLMKGADTTVAALLRSNDPILKATQEVVDRLSCEGLRTLFLARRSMSEEEYTTWRGDYVKAASSIKDREAQLAACYKSIEKNMELVGATAIEDQLQDNVIDTITNMRRAGMSFFILTGDKKETAISIGRSCGLISSKAIICEIPEYSLKSEQEWRAKMWALKQIKEDKVYLLRADTEIPPDLPLHQTICYRCNPGTKEAMVRLYKQKSQYLTMAVGDGANDVNMIIAADVGVGIRGKEGSEAARVADFVVGQFQLISLLTMYYGREWYRKNCRLVSYSLFKNWYHVSSVIAFGAFSYFSGVVIFNIYLYELINVFFASWPIIAFAVFDEEESYEESVLYADSYQVGIDNKEFNQTVYSQSIGLAVFYGIVSQLAVFYSLEASVNDMDGSTGYLLQSGSVLFCNIIIVINLRILVMCQGLRPFVVFTVFGSIGMYWLMYAIYANTMGPEMLLCMHQELTTPNIYFVHFIIVFFLIFLELAYKKYNEISMKLHRMTDRLAYAAYALVSN